MWNNIFFSFFFLQKIKLKVLLTAHQLYKLQIKTLLPVDTLHLIGLDERVNKHFIKGAYYLWTDAFTRSVFINLWPIT